MNGVRENYRLKLLLRVYRLKFVLFVFRISRVPRKMRISYIAFDPIKRLMLECA